MKTVKIKLVIDPANDKVVEALDNLLSVMGGNEGMKVKVAEKGQEASVEFNGEEKKPAKKVKETFVATEETAPPVEELELEPAEEMDLEESDDDAGTDEEVTDADVREVMGKKVTDHREAIKAKLTELGAKNLTVLDPAHYSVFYTFLNEL